MNIIKTEVDDDGVIYKTFTPFFKSPYNHDTDAESNRLAQTNKDPSLCQQHQAEEADINTIVKNFGVTGKLPLVDIEPIYGDFENAEDFHTMKNRLAETTSMFYKLPAGMRASFNNDPGSWLENVHEQIAAGNLDAVKTMGVDIEKIARTVTPTEPPGSGTAVTPPGGSSTPEPPKGAS